MEEMDCDRCIPFQLVTLPSAVLCSYYSDFVLMSIVMYCVCVVVGSNLRFNVKLEKRRRLCCCFYFLTWEIFINQVSFSIFFISSPPQQQQQHHLQLRIHSTTAPESYRIPTTNHHHQQQQLTTTTTTNHYDDDPSPPPPTHSTCIALERTRGIGKCRRPCGYGVQ